jgi:hypothetical protein
MPLWKVYHPVGAVTAADKKTLATRVTELSRSRSSMWYSFLRRLPRTAASSGANRITDLSDSRSTKWLG